MSKRLRLKQNKNCKQCGKEFVTYSGNASCHICLSEKVCECGTKISKTAKFCRNCFVKSYNHKEDNNPNFKTGKTVHKRNYIYVMSKSHPNCTRAGYVFEHILVMEEQLGRYLLPGENVHHKNGVRDDNRIENLELWCKPQPSGIRVEDAVKWAKQVLSLYEPEALTTPLDCGKLTTVVDMV